MNAIQGKFLWDGNQAMQDYQIYSAISNGKDKMIMSDTS